MKVWKNKTPEEIVSLVDKVDLILETVRAQWFQSTTREKITAPPVEISSHLLVTVTSNFFDETVAITVRYDQVRLGKQLAKWVKKRRPSAQVFCVIVGDDLFLVFAQESDDPLVREKQ